MNNNSYFVILSLFLSCTPSKHWKLSSLCPEEPPCLRYQLENSFGGIKLDFFYLNENLICYLSTRGQPLHAKSIVQIQLQNQTIEAPIELHEGGMKASLSHEIATQIARALEEGQSIKIVVDRQKQTIYADQFSKFFHQLIGKEKQFPPIFKGILQ